MHLHGWLQSLSMVGTIALLGACNGDGGGNTEDTGAASATMTGTGTATGSTGSTGATSTTGTSGGEPTSGGSVGQTDTGSTGVTSPGTTQGTDTSGGTTGGTSGGSTEGTTGDTGGMLGMPCESAADCQLADGCCSCEVLNPGEPAPPCDIQECLLTTCAGYGLEKAALECKWGACTFAKLPCNQLGVTCKSLPPECAPGDLPGVVEDDNGKCWSGSCVPAEACDWVKDCSYCAADDLVCVLKGQKGAYHVCEPRPLDCGPGEIDCECGQQICDASEPHTVCHDEDVGIQCECPFC